MPYTNGHGIRVYYFVELFEFFYGSGFQTPERTQAIANKQISALLNVSTVIFSIHCT